MNLEEEAKQFMHNKNRCLLVASDYQLKAKETAIFPKDKALEYLCLGLVGEAGEIANKAKKVIRDNKKDHDLGGEIGDVLWYCAMLADHLKLDLGEKLYFRTHQSLSNSQAAIFYIFIKWNDG